MTAEQPAGWMPEVPRETAPPLRITVTGVPIPQGSLRAFTRNGKAWASSDNPRTRPWKAAVTAEAAAAVDNAGLANPAYGREPVIVKVVFNLPRPKGHFGRHGLLPSAPAYPAVMPDLDKLARAILDALTGIVWRDDAQVVSLDVCKHYAAELVTTIDVGVMP